MDVSAFRLALIPGAVEALGRQISETPGFGEALDQSLNKIKSLSQSLQWGRVLSVANRWTDLIKVIKISRNIALLTTIPAVLIGIYTICLNSKNNKLTKGERQMQLFFPNRKQNMQLYALLLLEVIACISFIISKETATALCNVINATKIT